MNTHEKTDSIQINEMQNFSEIELYRCEMGVRECDRDRSHVVYVSTTWSIYICDNNI